MIETTITKIQYDADGVQRRWSIPFPYADVKHISIYTKVGDEPMVKVVDNYDIDEDDSVVIYPTVASGQEPVAAGTKIIIARETPETQLEDASQVHFTSKDVERGLDKLTMITQELSTTASETMEVSADAFKAAEEAVSTANEANATAGEAKTIAEQAVSVANDANVTVTTANTKSNTAIKTADDANEKSTAAVSTANTAKTVAGEANSTANKANATATEAKEIAAAANTTANNADKTANEADKKADNAVIVANNAKNIAEGIDGKATQALTNSTTALEMATEAKNTADSYQGQITTIESKIPSAASETNQLADKQFVQDLTSALNFVQWFDALPETGERKYIYAVPREETDTDGKRIAALYLWDGSAWRGAGAFSLNIDPDTLATKTELAGYLPLSGGTMNGALKIVGPKSLIQTSSGSETNGYTKLVLMSKDTNWAEIRLINSKGETQIRQMDNGASTIYNSLNKTALSVGHVLLFKGNKVLDTSDKSVANGVATLDANGKVPTEQIPVATTSTLGGVKPDGTTITVTEDGTISATGGSGSGDTIGLSIGDVVYSYSSLSSENPGKLPLFTGETIASANTIYPDFYNWVLSHTELQCTSAEYESVLSTYGECPKYVIGNGSLRLPKLSNYIKAANTAEGIKNIEAGLPNITGQTGVNTTGGNGVFSNTIENIKGTVAISGYNTTTITSYFDASRSSAVYGKSNTVTPASTTLYPWVVAYTAVIPASTAQAAQFQAALSGKVDVPSGKTQADVDFVVESYSDADGNWYRKYKSGWLEQGGYGKGNITFLKPYSSLPNVITGSANKTGDGWPARANEVTATGFYLYGGNQDTVSAYWEAKGQGGENV